MRLDRRQLIGAATALVALGERRAAAQADAITPESFGARGDGRTNDSDAFESMAAFVNSLGGGEISLRPTTYLVGRDAARRSFKNDASDRAAIMHFSRCRRPLVIRGNGARLRCESGLRFGTFDRLTGRATHPQMPNYSAEDVVTPYRAMIRAEHCTGSVEIRDLELDGNLSGLRIGGQYGDVGWQIPAVGIHLVNNRGPERLLRIHSHHHALDGLMIDGADDRDTTSSLEEVRSEFNGRQGCSIIGGCNYHLLDCSFSNTGKAGLASAPGAGVDIEAEAGKRVRNLRFARCKFSNNEGAGLVADGGDSEGATFLSCTFVGTTSWSAWPNRPRFRFIGCTFVGAIVHAFGAPDPAKACRFVGCSFLDDPARSPNRLVYGGANPSRPIADLPDNPNVLFDRCDFRLTDRSVLPWTTSVTIFANCRLNQRALAQSYPRGTFVGRNLITGNVDLYGARIEGVVILNGRRMGAG